MSTHGTQKHDEKHRDQSSERKQITISEKRQVTIPKRFFDALGLGSQVVCEVRGDELILKKAPKESDFSEEILKDLITEGYTDTALLQEFQQRKAQVRPAVEALIEESQQAANQHDETGEEEINELFQDIKE